jgi:hypothetical protein
VQRDPRRESECASDLALARLSVAPGAIEANRLERAIYFFECFRAEVRDAQQILGPTVEQIFHTKNATFLKAIGRTHRETDLGHTHRQIPLDRVASVFDEAKWNTCHGNTLPGFVRIRYSCACTLVEPSWLRLAAL